MEKENDHNWFFQQSPKEVWNYITKSELIGQWLIKNDFLPIPGHKFQFRHAPFSSISKNEKIHYCEVIEIVPLQRLSYSWKVGKGNDERTIDSIVVWKLSEKNGGAELNLLHNGFTHSDDVIAHANCWNACQNQFTQLLYTYNNANTKA